MSKKHRENRNPDSLIVVMIPLIPRYHNKHFGATDEPEDRSSQNMMDEDQEILTLARRDLELLKNTRRKNNFGDRFKNAVVYPHIIYLGQRDGENSLGEAAAFMKRQHKCEKEDIQNLAINITAHGNPETIGTKKSISFSPDEEMTGLASLAHGYISENISSSTKLSFYLLACNSGYVSYSDDDEDHVKSGIINKSFAGRFFKGLQKEAASEGVSMSMTVSGYRGYLGQDQGRLVATRNEEQTPKAGELAGADHVRFVIGNINSGEEVEVAIPKGYKFKVENVTKSLTTEEAFKHRINSSVLVESSSIGAAVAEVIPEVAVEEKPKATLKDVIALTFVFTIIEILKRQMNEELKAQIGSDAEFIEEISRGLHGDLFDKAYNEELESYDEVYGSDEEQELDGDSDNDISDNEMLESAFGKGSNVAKLLAARQSNVGQMVR